jgi:cytochrome c oxidase assembly protein subunit 15
MEATSSAAPGPSRALSWYARVVCVATLGLIFAGGMVTSTGSGLAVPDWPLSYGQLMPPMVGGIFYEHGHRMIATLVGLLTIGLAVWLQRTEPRPWVRRLGWLALASVCLQGLLGGLTVIFLLPTYISVSHAALAEMFFALTVALALFTSQGYRQAVVRSEPPRRPGFASLAAITAAMTYVQIILGALMRHTGAGLAIPDFPLAFGRLVPDAFTGGVAIHFAHRVGALAVLILSLWLLARALKDHRRHPELWLPAAMLVGLVFLQVALGAWTVWSAKRPVPTSLHVAVGAATWGTSVLLALRARLSVPAGRRAVAHARLQVAA